MTNQEKPTAAFILSLVGGVFILLGGGLTSMMGYWFGGMMGGFGFGGMMGQGFGMMQPLFGLIGMMGILGTIFGVIVILSAIMLNQKPQEHTTWGALIIVFSVASIFGSAMGGFGVGFLLGLLGGILAITWTPPKK